MRSKPKRGRGLISQNVDLSYHMGVSKNRGTPKSPFLIGFSLINHPFWGTPISGNTHIDYRKLNDPTNSQSSKCSYPPSPTARGRIYKKTYLDVSINRGTPKSSILIGVSIINHPFWGTPFLETPIYCFKKKRPW